MKCIHCQRERDPGIPVCPWCGYNHARTVAVLGDSISTFQGYNPKGYSVYYTPPVQKQNDMRSVKDTWWSIFLEATGAYLFTNNSYSGSIVSGGRYPAIGSEERLRTLGSEVQKPDIILVYAGCNDWGLGEPLNQFEGSYRLMLMKMKELYPKSRIICGTLMRTYLKRNPSWGFPEAISGNPLSQYNDSIIRCCKSAGVDCADLAAQGERYETLDGTHPTALGHEQIANAWIRCYEKLEQKRNRPVAEFLPEYDRRDVTLYGCPNAKRLDEYRLNKRMEIIDYDKKQV